MALEADESFEQAACRELFEETGLVVDELGPEVAAREFVFQMPDGEHVVAEERFFQIHVGDNAISRDRWTPLEREVMEGHRWWTTSQLAASVEVVFPEDLVAILESIGVR